MYLCNIMEQQQSSNRSATRLKIKHTQLYDVIIHNDDFTTMDFVVMILMDIFQKSEEDAIQLMLYVHESGEAIAGTYILDIAESKADKATKLARDNGFPLKLTTQPHQ